MLLDGNHATGLSGVVAAVPLPGVELAADAPSNRAPEKSVNRPRTNSLNGAGDPVTMAGQFESAVILGLRRTMRPCRFFLFIPDVGQTYIAVVC